ncbi:cystathionine gamma-synthase [Thraustotheca clavata]|uniref:Cystathionine gamma-synthase n=1 Tax=Thraustotheca clavata TaxID=74557 RepID=A0A1W0A9C1_9STRA|nr:cystathionine gamma-synthase [Thraustotheca clavata]
MAGPTCLSADLGAPLPDHVHAVSVSMPKWEHVERYEQGCPDLHAALRSGYPRFVYHTYVKALNARYHEVFGLDTSKTLFVLPTLTVAERCRDFIECTFPKDCVEIKSLCVIDAHAIIVPVEAAACFKSFWQHSGELISSRLAHYILDVLQNRQVGEKIEFKMDLTPAHTALRERIGSLYTTSGSNVNLYPSGMASIFAAFRLVQKLKQSTPGKTVLVGFPYLDTLKMMRRTEWSNGDVLFFPRGDKNDIDAIDALENIHAIFTEFPSNPLLQSTDLPRLAAIAHRHNTVLVVDDTVGSYNVNVLSETHGHAADLVASSLTKIFCGTGTVMGGSLIANPASPLFSTIQSLLENDSFLFEDDVVALLQASEDIHARLARINATAATIAYRLKHHSMVETIYYPKYINTSQYEHYNSKAAESDAHGPLLSLVVRGGQTAAKTFYDALTFAKGPSLGTNFTLSCPYTLLAHYDELDYVESCGVPRDLIRISIGLEDVEEVWSCLERALDKACE